MQTLRWAVLVLGVALVFAGVHDHRTGAIVAGAGNAVVAFFAILRTRAD